MELKERVVKYLEETYSPEAIIVYGSFSDGSANANSDFDALIIAKSDEPHDSSVVDGTLLDVWIYPEDSFKGEYDPEEYIQIFDGEIVKDENGVAKALQDRVLEYINEAPVKTEEEIRQDIDWCSKMLLRTDRGDAEGYFRWHWLLTDSLQIYFDAKHLYYFGPKKSLKKMAEIDPEGYNLYKKALSEFDQKELSAWIDYLGKMVD